MTKSGWPASPRPAGLGFLPSVHSLRVDAQDALWRSVQKAVFRIRQLGAGRPGSGGFSALRCTVTLLNGWRSFLDGYISCSLIVAQDSSILLRGSSLLVPTYAFWEISCWIGLDCLSR